MILILVQNVPNLKFSVCFRHRIKVSFAVITTAPIMFIPCRDGFFGVCRTLKIPFLDGEKGSRIVITIVGIIGVAAIVTVRPDLRIIAAIKGLCFSLTLNLLFPAWLYLLASRVSPESLSLLSAPRGIAPSSTYSSSTKPVDKGEMLKKSLCWLSIGFAAFSLVAGLYGTYLMFAGS